MKQKKLSLLKVKENEMLSRNEMKHIMAGSGGGGSDDIGCKETYNCNENSTIQCSATGPHAHCNEVVKWTLPPTHGVKCTDGTNTITEWCGSG